MHNNAAEQMIYVRSEEGDNVDEVKCTDKRSVKSTTVSTTKTAKITYGFETVPHNATSGEPFTIRVVARNPTDTFHTIDVWSYVYKGSISLSGDREGNKKTINLPDHSTVRFDLVTLANASEGSYKLKVKILRDDLKTPAELTTEIAVNSGSKEPPDNEKKRATLPFS